MFRKALKLGTALAVVALSAWGALALNVDQNRNTVARANQTQQTSYYRLTINYNDSNISTAQKFGRLLQNTFISNVACHVTTAFNAVTTNYVTLGTTSSPSEIMNPSIATKSIAPGTLGYQQITAATSLGVSVTSAADVDLYAMYKQTGTAATAGAVTCILEFIPNNDL